MIRLISLIAVAIFFLQACAQMPAGETGSTDGRTTQTQQPTVSYMPGDREQFVLAEKPDQLQKYGFDGFCTDTESFACRNRLDYERYVGMKGYFNTDEPSHTDFSGYQFWPVVLENGREFYYVSNPKYGGKYGSSADIVPLEQYEQAASYSAEPLVPGSKILVESVEISFGRDVFTLDNGDQIGRDKLDHIRNIASQFPASQATIAEALLSFRITHDEVENRYFIQPKGSALRNEARLYIGVKPDKTWLRMKIKYYGDDWLFVRSYKVAADSFRWESPSLEFERDHSGGNVWEWIDKSPTDEDLRNMRALAAAANPIIRFQGRQYYSDFKLTGEQQSSITSILRLYELLKR
ncbi:hypothetical protein [Thiohalophilus sp.]|uniref:hypothetical protein n=1 Tax=Thiohalophilus sp. TaxID=3028392 RepID=UPI002ACEE2FB|nr:hypothetical protein [Thiohalophilus sp.]MDZ7663153.1 hypothetical protein [Thiohalophilus sp.]